ncbi:MAG: hypothetical protein AB7N65_16670 [Vicinamibacterales bacterium]
MQNAREQHALVAPQPHLERGVTVLRTTLSKEQQAKVEATLQGR